MIDKETVKAVIAEMRNGFGRDMDYFSTTRDVFTARLQSFVTDTGKYLEAAIIGEIGNNTFDHNFVFGSEYPRGVYCNFAYRNKYTVLADFGRGIKQSLLDVLPSIKSDAEAVETAFIKRISGRSPEQRGNGLKFVSETIQQNKWHLYFQSGSGCYSINNIEKNFFVNAATAISGCMAIIDFSGAQS
jgi:hypothetical protein